VGAQRRGGKGPKRSRGAEESPSLIQSPGRSQIRSTRENSTTVVEEQTTDEDANDVESRTSSRDKRFIDRMFVEFSDLLAELL